MERAPRARLTAAQGRKFGLTLSFGFGAIGTLLLWRGAERAAWVLLALGAAMLGAGLLVPTKLGPVERAWMKLGLALSRVTTPIFYTALYLLVITPMGLVRRTFSRSPVARNHGLSSFWIARESRGAEDRRQSMERQF